MEVTSRSGQERPPTGVFTVALVGAIALACFLLFLVVRSPASGPRFAVGNAIGTACPAGEGIPACFNVTVTNTGSEASEVRCEVSAMTGNTATFLGGEAAFARAGSVRPGQPLELTVAVTTETGTVFTPDVSCGPA